MFLVDCKTCSPTTLSRVLQGLIYTFLFRNMGFKAMNVSVEMNDVVANIPGYCSLDGQRHENKRKQGYLLSFFGN